MILPVAKKTEEAHKKADTPLSEANQILKKSKKQILRTKTLVWQSNLIKDNKKPCIIC